MSKGAQRPAPSSTLLAWSPLFTHISAVNGRRVIFALLRLVMDIVASLLQDRVEDGKVRCQCKWLAWCWGWVRRGRGGPSRLPWERQSLISVNILRTPRERLQILAGRLAIHSYTRLSHWLSGVLLHSQGCSQNTISIVTCQSGRQPTRNRPTLHHSVFDLPQNNATVIHSSSHNLLRVEKKHGRPV